MQLSSKSATPDRKIAPGEKTPCLEISLTERCVQPTENHHLLVGFQFGATGEEPTHPAIVNLQLRPLNHDQLTEAWWYHGDVIYTQSGSVRLAECQEYTVAIFQNQANAPGDIRSQTRQAYHELIHAVRSTKHSRLVKIWNYFNEINSGDGDSEKYRQFSYGRAEAFQDMGIRDEESPTGTAIGTQAGGLTLIALASDHHYCPVENPRQTSAFSYPRIYGPKSPKFSRGGFVSSENHQLFLISGTASVVGHESNFPYNTRLQTDETIKNLAHLCEAISDMESAEARFTMDEPSVLRIYLKDPDDYRVVKAKVDEHLNTSERNVTYLHGTICRRELTVEIDGVKVVRRSGKSE